MSRAVRWVEWVTLILILVMVLAGLAGCATLTPAQESTLADWRDFAHRVTQHYGKPDVYIMIGENPQAGMTGTGAMRSDGIMYLSQEILTPPPPGSTKQFVLAHELGHYVLNRFGCGIPCELDANAEAVKILVIGRNGAITEGQAFNIVIGTLWFIKGRQDNGHPVLYRHPPACVEIADLAARFPQYNGKKCDMGMPK